MNRASVIFLILVLAVGLCRVQALTLVYGEDFSADPPAGWTVINTGAGNSWNLTASLQPYSGTHHMQYQWDQEDPADTWAFTPGIELTADYAYHVEFFQRVMSLYCPESMMVTVGSAPDPAAQTTILLNLPGVDNMAYANRVTDSFVSAAGGVYYFGFHCYSAADMYYLLVDLVQIFREDQPAVIWDFPWSESFDQSAFPPPDWSVVNGDSGPVAWARNANFMFTHDGEGSAWHNYSSVPPGGQNGWLITPSMAIPNAGNYFFSFWTFNLLPQRLVYNGFKVNTSPDPAAPGWVELWSQDEPRAEWRQVAVNLGAYAGQTIYCGFHYQGYNADAWIIDRCEVTGRLVDILPPISFHLPLLDTPLADGFDGYTVSAEITDDPFWNNPVSGAELIYSLDGGASWEPPLPMVPGTPPEWSAAIPAQDLGTTVTYYLSASDIFENNGWSDPCEFSVQDPVWLRYDQGGTVFLGYTSSSFGAAVLFENPFWETGIPLQVLKVDACSYFAATANLHIYGWDGLSWATLADLIPGPPPVCAFTAQIPQSFAVGVYVDMPWFLVSFEDFAPGNYLAFDHRYDYGTTFAKVGGQYYLLSNPGSWRLGAEVSGAVQNLAISLQGGVPTLSWDEYQGATGYDIYFLPYGPIEPYPNPWWLFEDGWASSPYPYNGPDSQAFFRVTAEFPDPLRRSKHAPDRALPVLEPLAAP